MSGRMHKNLIEIRQGDTFIIVLHLMKLNCQNVDLSHSIARMQVRNNEGQLVWELLSEPIKSDNDDMILHITPTLSNIAVGEYQCDIQLEMDDGSINTIWPANVNQIGTLRITKQVTKEE